MRIAAASCLMPRRSMQPRTGYLPGYSGRFGRGVLTQVRERGRGSRDPPFSHRFGNLPGHLLMSQSILVTGGAGYVGSHACKALAAADYRPVVFDDLSRGHAEAVRWGPLVRGNLHDRARLVEAMRAHRVA